MAFSDVIEPDGTPVVKPTGEAMMEGILKSAAFATREKQYERSIFQIERAVRNGYYKAIDRTQNVEGDEVPDLYRAIESLYLKLATKAAEEERRASATLEKLGVRK